MKIPPDFSSEENLAAGWIREMSEGRVAGLNSLYTLYHRPLLGFVSGIVADSGAVEEILQDTFVRAYRHADRFDPILGTPFSWLATIAKRLAIDWLRKQRRQPEIYALEGEQTQNPEDKGLLDEQISIQTRLEMQWIGELLSGLSPSQREVIDLAMVHGYTHHEIAKALDRPLGTVKSDLRRGLLSLKKSYLSEDEG